MMRKLAHHKGPDLLEENRIQGLYPSKNCCQSFWTLKVKVELAVFNKKEGET